MIIFEITQTLMKFLGYNSTYSQSRWYRVYNYLIFLSSSTIFIPIVSTARLSINSEKLTNFVVHIFLQKSIERRHNGGNYVAVFRRSQCHDQGCRLHTESKKGASFVGDYAEQRKL